MFKSLDLGFFLVKEKQPEGFWTSFVPECKSRYIVIYNYLYSGKHEHWRLVGFPDFSNADSKTPPIIRTIINANEIPTWLGDSCFSREEKKVIPRTDIITQDSVTDEKFKEPLDEMTWIQWCQYNDTSPYCNAVWEWFDDMKRCEAKQMYFRFWLDKSAEKEGNLKKSYRICFPITQLKSAVLDARLTNSSSSITPLKVGVPNKPGLYFSQAHIKRIDDVPAFTPTTFNRFSADMSEIFYSILKDFLESSPSLSSYFPLTTISSNFTPSSSSSSSAVRLPIQQAPLAILASNSDDYNSEISYLFERLSSQLSGERSTNRINNVAPGPIHKLLYAADFLHAVLQGSPISLINTSTGKWADLFRATNALPKIHSILKYATDATQQRPI